MYGLNFWRSFWTSAPNLLRATPRPKYGARNSHISQMVLEGQDRYQTVGLVFLINNKNCRRYSHKRLSRRPSRRAKLAVIWLWKPQIWIFCHESFSIWLAVLRYTTYPMERSIGCRMADLEPIKGYNCTKTAIIYYLKSGFCEKNYLQIPTPPRPFNVFEQTLY